MQIKRYVSGKRVSEDALGQMTIENKEVYRILRRGRKKEEPEKING